MTVKHHCIICGDLIFGGMYCSSCSREIGRTRTLDDEPLEEWISRARTFKVPVPRPSEEAILPLDAFWKN